MKENERIGELNMLCSFMLRYFVAFENGGFIEARWLALFGIIYFELLELAPNLFCASFYHGLKPMAIDV